MNTKHDAKLGYMRSRDMFCFSVITTVERDHPCSLHREKFSRACVSQTLKSSAIFFKDEQDDTRTLLMNLKKIGPTFSKAFLISTPELFS